MVFLAWKDFVDFKYRLCHSLKYLNEDSRAMSLLRKMLPQLNGVFPILYLRNKTS